MGRTDKLSPEQKQWAYDRRCEGVTMKRIAQALGVNDKTIGRMFEPMMFDDMPNTLKYPDTQRMTWRTELPTDNSDKLVTYADGSIGIDFYDLEFGWNYGDTTGKKVLAWMNLPLPYDGKES